MDLTKRLKKDKLSRVFQLWSYFQFNQVKVKMYNKTNMMRLKKEEIKQDTEKSTIKPMNKMDR